MEELQLYIRGLHEGADAATQGRRRLDAAVARIHRELVNISGVSPDEVAILLREGAGALTFHRPEYLIRRGYIPLNYSGAFVNRVIQERRPAIENRFQSAPHFGLIEGIRKGDKRPNPVQKMMCLPLVGEGGEPYGAVQICRKGATRPEAGPDWTQSDLVAVATVVDAVAVDLQRLCQLAGIL